ncbi:hypothetical protein [Polaribacter cellanae]|uniref:Uncharacterized protein n=1 Tax=Polaribacter cellanae TaxID=2818493 RepID=A0A975H569_9FLAO|nr:hypothetical protein [Polaribacter cellanae]QTE21077.1 hypothetical protein J3359_09465 [Polaribacter cellanae]
MVTQHQYLIFESEFISMLKRLTKFLANRGSKVTHKSSLDNNNCLINIFSIYYYLYNNEKIIVSDFFHNSFNFGEIFNTIKGENYKSTPILKCEIVGDSEFPISIDFTVYVKPDNQTHSLCLILDKDFDNKQILEFHFEEWRKMMSTFVEHIIKKLQ